MERHHTYIIPQGARVLLSALFFFFFSCYVFLILFPIDQLESLRRLLFCTCFLLLPSNKRSSRYSTAPPRRHPDDETGKCCCCACGNWAIFAVFPSLSLSLPLSLWAALGFQGYEQQARTAQQAKITAGDLSCLATPRRLFLSALERQPFPGSADRMRCKPAGRVPRDRRGLSNLFFLSCGPACP